MKKDTVFIDAAKIEVLPWVERAAHRDDKDLEASIQKGGVQHPLVVVYEDGRCLLVKGSRRLRIGKRLGLPRFRCVVETLPRGMTAEQYISEVRLLLVEHRQGLPPSVEAGFLQTLKERFSFNNLQLSRYRGVEPDTITAYLHINSYIQPVKDALDAEQLTMQSAEVFQGMTELGQSMIWKKHGKDLMQSKLNSDELRRMYRPNVYPAWYVAPEKEEARLERPGKNGKKRRTRVTYNPDERKRLMASVDVKQLILEEMQAEANELIERRKRALKIAPKLLRKRKLRALMSDDQAAALTRFCEEFGVA
jgi:ParB/RepB/Spo0J family partition protein